MNLVRSCLLTFMPCLQMEEVSLLIDTLKQLDELFLSVVVGEFNSGKSSIINALLGKRFLKEGVLPTTNEITLLRHASDGGDTEEREEPHPDGHFLRFLPANLLKQMNLVDTQGTKVILQRQQRLTEEFVPRADLVLFVLSADMALTESEVSSTSPAFASISNWNLFYVHFTVQLINAHVALDCWFVCCWTIQGECSALEESEVGYVQSVDAE